MDKSILSLIDFEKVNLLLEGFNKSTGFVTAILDLDGNILFKSDWRQICTKFHRVHPETAKRCTESDTVLAGQMKTGKKYHFYKCLNGLMDVAVPIIINDEHVANLFLGQFFFEKPKRDFFEDQAKKYNFDNSEYLEALDKVPVVSQKKVKSILAFLLDMTQLLSEMTMQKIEQNDLNDALKRSEEKFRSVFENSSLGKSLTGIDGTLQVNKSFCDILGYSEQELKSKKWQEFTHPDDISLSSNIVQDLLDGKKDRVQFEKRYIHKNGTIVWTDVITTLKRDKDNKPEYFITSIQDITENKLAEEKLKDSEQKYKALYENAPLSYQSLNEDGTFKDVNPRWLETMGYERDEVIGKKYADFLHPEWQKHFEKNFPAFKKRGYVNNVQFKIRHKKGHYIDISFEGCIGYNSDGSFRQTYCVFQDITDRKQAEEKLKVSEEKFSLLYNSSPDMHASVSPKDATILFCNDTFLKNIAYSKDEVIGASIFDMYHDDCMKDVKDAFQQFVNTGEVNNSELILKRKDGSKIDVSLKVFAVRDESGEIIYSMSSWRDITDHKQATVALKQSEAFNRGIVDNSFDCIKILDLEGNLRFMSEGGQKLLEIQNIQDYIGKSWFDLFAGEERKLAIAAVKKAISGEIGRFKSSVPKENGNLMWWDAIVTPIADDKGKLMSILAISRDITEQKITEKALIQSEEKFRGVYEQSPIAIEIYDRRGTLMDVNQQTLDMFGIDNKKYVLCFNLWEDPNLSSEQMADLKNGKSILISTDFDFEDVKKHNHYPSNRSGIMYMDMYAIPLMEENSITGYLVQIIEVTKSKQAETEIIKLNKVLKDTNKMAKIGGWELDVETGDASWTEEVALIHELGPNESIDLQQGLSFYTPNSRIQIEDAIKNAIDKVQSYDLVLEMITANGNRKWVRTIGQPIQKEEKVVRIHGSFQDITNQKSAELQIRENEELFRTIFEQSASGMCLTGLDGKLISVNLPLCEMLGYSRNELEGLHFNSITFPEDIEIGTDSVKKMLVGESQKVAFEKRYLTKSGETIWVRINSALIRNQENDPRYFITQMENVTQRVSSDIQLKSSENKYKALVEQSLTGIYIFNKECFLYVNSQLCEIFGYTEEEMLSGMTPTDIIADDDREKVDKKIYKRLKGETKSERYIARANHKNGQELWVEIHGTHIELDGEDVITGTVLDISERKQAEKKLKERSEYIESILSNMPIGFAVNSIDDGVVKYMNQKFEDIYGWPRNILTNTSVFFEKVFPDPEYRDKMTNQIVSDMQSGDPERMIWKDLQIVTNSGEVRYVHAFNIPLPDQNLMISTVQDTTKRKLAEEELIKHRENLEELVKERTKNLDEKNDELERMNNLFVGRELRMVELKEKIKKLESEE